MGLEHWLQLSLTAGLGPILIGRLIDRMGSAESAVGATLSDIQGIEGIGSAKGRSIHESMKRAAADAADQFLRAQAAGATIVCPDDAAYPDLLRTITDPPPVLYMLGALEARDLQGLAVVGSRKCSHYGREQADRFGALLAGAGFTVISGGARGVDSAAHEGALRHPQGRTIAVLGCGLDIVYPPENGPLFKRIVERGALISEYPFGTPPNSENFPRRNRIVSGMSRGVLVIEADERSGALITARLANEDQGRTVFALPGRIDNRMSTGPHRLIRDGAVLVTCLEDILEGLDPLPHSVTQPTLWPEIDPDAPPAAAPEPPKPDSTAPPSPLSDRQSLILDHLETQATTVDQLIDRTGLDAAAILQELTFLSLKGMAKRIDGQTYARRAHRT